MGISSKEIEKIEEVFNFLISKSEWYNDIKEDLYELVTNLKNAKNQEKIVMPFPDDYESMEINIVEFLSMCDEILSMNIESDSYITTKNRSYYIVEAKDSTEEYLIKEYLEFNLEKDNGIKIRIIDQSMIVGIAATILEEFDKEYWGTFNQYIVVEVIYDYSIAKLLKEKEKELVISFLFEITDSFNISLSFTRIYNPNDDYFERIDEADENPVQELRKLIPYNEGMKLFISAMQIKDFELQFLNFYKVLEYFSPIAINIDAYELMRKKLDIPNNQKINGDYIKSIFELANITKTKFNDEDLIKSSLAHCIDFVGLFEKLPISMQHHVKKQCKITNLSYSTSNEKIETARNMVGKIIYKTRNNVVHAKSNFRQETLKVETDEIQELNIFMKDACSQAIRWYGRLPDHLKLVIIS